MKDQHRIQHRLLDGYSPEDVYRVVLNATGKEDQASKAKSTVLEAEATAKKTHGSR